MKTKTLMVFLLSVVVFFFAAAFRWGDSAHSIGLIKEKGGWARHPSVMESGYSAYNLIATATVIPPYRGDARIVLEGEPKMAHTLSLSQPVIDLGLRRRPLLKGDTLYDLQPKDRIALWVMMKSPVVDPVCGMGRTESFSKNAYKGKEYYFCSDACLEAFRNNPEKYRDMDGARGKYTLAFYDKQSGRPVLRVPIIFNTREEAGDAGEHHH